MANAAAPKWLRWEFWPYPVFYVPVYFLVLAHAVRCRSLTYFTLANPGVRHGGFVSYSKSALLMQLPEAYRPAMLKFDAVPAAEQVVAAMQAAGLQFPVVLKPDFGERGWKVEKINDVAALRNYLMQAPQPLLVQQFVAGPEEFGVMYVRYPGQRQGQITSLMQREFLTVVGDGKSTLDALMQQHERCRYYLPRLRRRHADSLHTVLAAGEQRILEEIGNHNRGTTFRNITPRISRQLTEVFDRLSEGLSEWYFGRFDVRAASLADLEAGRFQVMEINGVNSEPAHIYDPSMKLLQAYRDLFSHWNHIYRIARANKRRGFHPAAFRDTYRDVRRHLRLKKLNPNR